MVQDPPSNWENLASPLVVISHKPFRPLKHKYISVSWSRFCEYPADLILFFLLLSQWPKRVTWRAKMGSWRERYFGTNQLYMYLRAKHTNKMHRIGVMKM